LKLDINQPCLRNGIFLIVIQGQVSRRCPSLAQAIAKRFSPEGVKINLAAFDEALKFARKLKTTTITRVVEDSFSI